MNKALKHTIVSLFSNAILCDKQCSSKLLSRFKSQYELLLNSNSSELESLLMQKAKSTFQIVGAMKSEVRTFTGQEDNFKGIEKGSVAVVPVQGVMMRDDYCTLSQGFVSGTRTLENLVSSLDKLDNVSAVVFSVNTPGGQADGNESLARAIGNMKKPSLVHFEMMASAGVAAFQGVKEIYANESGSYWGSIGTMASWLEDGEYLKSLGIELKEVYAQQSTLKNIESRELKNDNQQPLIDMLSKDAASFISRVQKARPQIQDDGDVFKGRLYTAKEARKIKAIDGIKSLDEVIKRAKSLGRKNSKNQNQKQNQSMGFLENMSNFFNGATEEEKKEMEAKAVAEDQKQDAEIKALQEAKQNLVAQNSELQVSNTNLQQEIEALKTAIEEQKAITASQSTQITELTQTGESLVSELEKATAHNKEIGGLKSNATPIDSQQVDHGDKKPMTVEEKAKRALEISRGTRSE